MAAWLGHASKALPVLPPPPSPPSEQGSKTIATIFPCYAVIKKVSPSTRAPMLSHYTWNTYSTYPAAFASPIQEALTPSVHARKRLSQQRPMVGTNS